MNSKDKNFGKIDLKSVIKEESRIQKLKKNVSKASSSLKNKLEGFFTVDKEESEEYNEDESENPKEGEESLYVAENGDLHYVDENGNIFKCREENGEYLLEEQIAVGKSKEKEENHKEVQEKTDKEKKNENEYEWEEILINKEENKGKLSILKKKKNLISVDIGKCFKCFKPNSKSMKLVQLIKQKITRYIFLEAPFLYVLSKEKKNMFKIRSMVNLLFIYRIFVNKNNEKLIKIEILSENPKSQNDLIYSKNYEFEKSQDRKPFLNLFKAQSALVNKELKIYINEK